MAITREAIIQAAETLERDGEKPTLAAVREILGGGSFATISPVLREWREGRETIRAVVLEMPGELKTVMERLGSEFWQAASKLANEKLVMVQAEADNAVADARSEWNETLREVARLEGTTASLGDQVRIANQQKETAQAALLQLKEQLQTEAIRLREKLAGSQGEVGQLRDNVVRVGQEKDRLASEASRLQGLNEALKRELQQSIAAREHLQDSLKAQQAESLALKTSVATLEARLEERNGKVAQLEAELATLREARQQASQQTANLMAERDSGKARIRELVQECGELRQENKTLLLMNMKLRHGEEPGA